MQRKRIWAMMGVVYVVIAFLLVLYWMARMTLIRGITGIIVFPACGALSAQFFNQAWIIRHGRVGHVEDPDFQEPEEPQPGWQRDAALGAVFALLTLLVLAMGVREVIAWFAAGGAAGHT
ncbi:MAG: hypothetical protein LUC87_04925 [Clostridiales bacterium]|nr:hypothetical protein [Clostridiales bacterium]MCD8368691.1 hypothetical protein [Clostridiales bacterium]